MYIESIIKLETFLEINFSTRPRFIKFVVYKHNITRIRSSNSIRRSAFSYWMWQCLEMFLGQNVHGTTSFQLVLRQFAPRRLDSLRCTMKFKQTTLNTIFYKYIYVFFLFHITKITSSLYNIKTYFFGYFL